jgi:anti-sigma B factor antagonist
VSELPNVPVGPNEARVAVANGPLVGAVLGRVVGMLAARAQCPIDKLDDALLITDAGPKGSSRTRRSRASVTCWSAWPTRSIEAQVRTASSCASACPSPRPETIEDAMPPEFSLSQESLDNERHVVAVRGEIDLFTAPELKSALSEAIESGHTRIVVDLTDTTFLDSTALGVLIGAVKRLRSRDGRLTIVNVDDNIAKTFEITGLDQIFPISATRAEAVKALDAEEAASS